MGDEADLVVAFNEQVLLGRHRLHSLKEGATILLENMWASHPDEAIQAQWAAAMEELTEAGYRIVEVPMEDLCLTVVDNARKGKNMFALGMLCWVSSAGTWIRPGSRSSTPSGRRARRS